MTTVSMTLVAIFGLATAVKAGGEKIMIQAKPIDADGNPSGALVAIDSSDESIASVSSAEQLGNAPLAVIGNSAGQATITATAKDGSGITATLVITVT